MFKSGVRALFHRLGYDITPVLARTEVALTDALSRLFDRYAVETVLDVGANVGQYAHWLRSRLGFSGRIISFEPNPADFAVLHAKNEAYPWALGAVEETLTLNVTKHSVYSSFYKPQIDDAGSEIVERISVPVRPLDGVIRELGIDPTRAFLKIDTQGFELDVLRGARRSLPSLIGIQAELSVRPLYESSVAFTKAIEEIQQEYDFEVAGMSPVGFYHNAVQEFDCVFVNNRLRFDAT